MANGSRGRTARKGAGHLGLEVELRDDHAAYLASWVRAIKADPKAIWKAAAQAEAAARWVLDRVPAEVVEVDEPELVSVG